MGWNRIAAGALGVLALASATASWWNPESSGDVSQATSSAPGKGSASMSGAGAASDVPRNAAQAGSRSSAEADRELSEFSVRGGTAASAESLGDADARALTGPAPRSGFFADLELPAEMQTSAAAAPAAAAALGPLTAELLVSGLDEPIYATAIPGDPRLFVLERNGRVRIVVDGAVRSPDFLDINTQVGTAREGGLLGMAFDPNHPFNGLFYLFYTNLSGDTVVSRFKASGDPNLADDDFLEEELLTVDQPAGNHNGGTIAFSPVDGHLYIGLGDGGGSNDPAERAQNSMDLLGKMLRIDVSGGAGTPYAIPADNPFILNPSVRSEIWALGLRNPFRFAFDWVTGDLWMGDVGQGAREEVNFEMAGDSGHNYGWDVREGSIASPAGDDALPPYVNAPPFTDPIYDYDHSSGRCSITGGSVYRGPIAAEDGLYFFGDYCTGEIWSLDPGNAPVDRTADLAPAIAQFALAAIGEGGFGALYVVQLSGSIYRLGPTGSECSDGIDNDGDGAMDHPDDTGCADANDPSELDTEVPCSDGFDNDEDGDIDFPADSDCVDATSTAELKTGSNGGGGGGGGGDDGCGIGFELILLCPLLWLRQRRRQR